MIEGRAQSSLRIHEPTATGSGDLVQYSGPLSRGALA